MHFTELDGATREWMLRRFEDEEAGGRPYRSPRLTPLGLSRWPDLVREAITDEAGTERTLADTLDRPEYWHPTEPYRLPDGGTGVRRVNRAQAATCLALSEFNTWYVAGLAARLRSEGETHCRIHLADTSKGTGPCPIHEGDVRSLTQVIAAHRITYWPPPGRKDAFAVPATPNCHHTIARLTRVSGGAG